jgi:AcrR family transcriptional regulator
MTKTKIDISTEEKLKDAARVVFTRKGYAATKVRDIAAEANINLALVNYYFRSKQKLFELIMDETIQKLFDKIQKIINNESSTLIEKVENVADHYISLLLENPELPLFFLSEVMTGSNKLTRMTDNGKMFFKSHFVKQLAALQTESKIKFNPVNILMNMIGMIVFPFLARPLLLKSGNLSEQQFKAILEERKKLIPLWLMQMIEL